MSTENELKRTVKFARNQSLEDLLNEVNENLSHTERKLMTNQDLNFPVVFVMGPLRSGTTLITQWLANTGAFAYPTNLLSRFYQAPIIGAKIQLLLADEKFNYRDELKDFSSQIDFQSSNGKTKGALAPNEFWYFWRRFLPFGELDYLPTEDLLKYSDTRTMLAEFAGMMNVFQKPLALKGMILNYNIDFLDNLFEKAIFIHAKRDPLANIESALKARERQLGSIDKWYSFKIPEYYDLLKLDPHEQVAGQIYYINKSIESGLKKVSQHKQMTVQYEDFCKNPAAIYSELKDKLSLNGYNLDDSYGLQSEFDVSRKKVVDEKILDAWKKFNN
ncbi:MULTISPECIES: sulfotransferase [unclassified Halomonas]|uniref:sulfotransferase n=1 Tax=unclassified Halomonas TaxID=2609666 RepID=UPI0004B4D028|nr:MULTISPECIES: sulfotransferase [unclassified Halomonas]